MAREAKAARTKAATNLGAWEVKHHGVRAKEEERVSGDPREAQARQISREKEARVVYQLLTFGQDRGQTTFKTINLTHGPRQCNNNNNSSSRCHHLG